jgi:hypothetical protein
MTWMPLVIAIAVSLAVLAAMVLLHIATILLEDFHQQRRQRHKHSNGIASRSAEVFSARQQ